MSSAIFSRAVERGEISRAVLHFEFAECLFGSVLMHVMNLPMAAHQEAKATAHEHVRLLVHIVSAGIGATVPT
ncbi:MAG: TetR family transcriptional regulator [Mycobacterium sp.]|jgi:hypothetical protein|nr:TetR family transcriptional regulator [Mycobacterium sp.]